jgi:hypothetical protein
MKDDYTIAICPKCDTEFEFNGDGEEPKSCGYFCPECKRKGYTLRGILYFYRKPSLLPGEISTA